ncbi:MAG: ABC transporter ATP-binding protein [Elusimicrobia bacterium]|nr:ABC transporter ATP-binding protein [Elusimicrobiota bacterium]
MGGALNQPAALRYSAVVKDYEKSHLGRVTRTRALDGLDLEVRAGEIYGLLGLNGNGKTTTMKLALGLLRPSAGEISVFGRLPGSAESLCDVGYLPELPYFYPYLSPREALRFYGALSGLVSEDLDGLVGPALEKVGLTAAADRKIGEFSKGMLQRLGLAQAILHRPRLVLLDEPVSGLDPLAVHDVRGLLRALNEEGCSLLMASHSISDVERLCARVGILVNGRLARVVEQAEWAGESGQLERIFVETVRPARGGR